MVSNLGEGDQYFLNANCIEIILYFLGNIIKTIFASSAKKFDFDFFFNSKAVSFISQKKTYFNVASKMFWQSYENTINQEQVSMI